ncbi:hypothetical protein J005_04105 [Cryptococcus neoformans]|nr:hypothetical protein C344_04011 [Cryptococcus neoformans var. grubii AD1-7a]OXH29805.1 hypothetical protein J005_04105 [Cryptococcus neoformans var. grubii]
MSFLDGDDDTISFISQQTSVPTSAAAETIKTSAKAAGTSKASDNDYSGKATFAAAAQTSKTPETSVAAAATSATSGNNSSNGVADTVSTCINQSLDSAGCQSGRAANEGAIIGGAVAGVIIIGLLIYWLMKRKKKQGVKKGFWQGKAMGGGTGPNTV